MKSSYETKFKNLKQLTTVLGLLVLASFSCCSPKINLRVEEKAFEILVNDIFENKNLFYDSVIFPYQNLQDTVWKKQGVFKGLKFCTSGTIRYLSNPWYDKDSFRIGSADLTSEEFERFIQLIMDYDQNKMKPCKQRKIKIPKGLEVMSFENFNQTDNQSIV